MRFTKQLQFFISIIFASGVVAQDTPFQSTSLTQDLKRHISILAHDSLEGRLVGSRAEAKASAYIISQFKLLQIQPKGETGFLQPFSFKRSLIENEGTILEIKKKGRIISFAGHNETLKDIGVYPLSNSSSNKVSAKAIWVGYGIVSSDGKMNDYIHAKDLKGKIFIMQHGYPSTSHAHSLVAEASSIEKKVDNAIAQGAVGVVIINLDSMHTVPPYKKQLPKNISAKIPVIFLNRQYTDVMDVWEDAMVRINPLINEKEITGNNVIGYIDNNATHTIVIGAHYDHLGRDEFGHSTYRGDEKPQIHNGADDNASGTAALMVLADILKKHGSKNMNYLFIAFSGEEEGLLGSNYFVKNPTMDLKKVTAMINMDMVGRLDPQKYTLGINGTGTAKEWKNMLDGVKIDSLKYKYTESGTGASDHTSFYLMNIPALHYFTGTHHDYHKPSDDEHLIQYDGIIKVITHIYKMNESISKNPTLTFQKTKEDTTAKVSFKVTLGIMPDYMYDGAGVMVDGVTADRPAAKAGIVKGDCVIQLGDIKIADMQSYMKALSQFSKGQQTTVRVKRNGKEMEMPLTF